MGFLQPYAIPVSTPSLFSDAAPVMVSIDSADQVRPIAMGFGSLTEFLTNLLFVMAATFILVIGLGALVAWSQD